MRRNSIVEGTSVALHTPIMLFASRLAGIISSSALAVMLAAACAGSGDASGLSAEERTAIADSIRHQVIAAYDFGKPDFVAGMMSLYPQSGRVISAASGTVTSSRQELQAQIESFWNRIGKNMQKPKWEWTSMHFDVLSKTSAVLTATYRVPHFTPGGKPHVIGGAWTAVFQLRNGRWVIVQEHLSDSPTP